MFRSFQSAAFSRTCQEFTRYLTKLLLLWNDECMDRQNNQNPQVGQAGISQDGTAPQQAAQPPVTQEAQVPPVPAPQVPQTPVAAPAASQQTPPVSETSPSQPVPVAADEAGSYITNVGQSMVDLLTDISTSDVAKQKIAARMRLPVEQVAATCNRLLDKIDNVELTEEDLAFLLTAPIADEESAS